MYSKEATGDAISSMIDELDSVNNIKSPYKVVGEQLHNELRGVENTVTQLFTRIEKLW